MSDDLTPHLRQYLLNDTFGGALMKEPVAAYEKEGTERAFAALRAENEQLRTANRVLHRRAQQVEAPAQSYKAQLAYITSVNGQNWVHEFHRLTKAHTEVQRIFQQLARVFDYPMNAECFHSVMDSNCESLKDTADGAVYANCFLSKSGGMKSYRVLDEVRRAVDELVALRGGNVCKWPNCMSEKEQNDLADQIYRELYSGEPEPQPLVFRMRGANMTFTVGVQTFKLDYEPDPAGDDFAFMSKMLTEAIGRVKR